MTDCIFCRIASGAMATSVVLEEDQILAFEDTHPQAPVHILLIPRKHISTTLDLTAEDDPVIGRLIRAAATVASQRGIASDGYRLVLNTNGMAGQSVDHLHVHLLGGRQFTWPPG